jgi:nicotinamidase/pyrazinamidase
MQEKDALVLVDVQNDFCPGGALGVKDGDEIVPVLNRYIETFAAARLPIFITRDWHPARTSHFKDFGGVWPAHCVQNTAGAEFHRDLRLDPSMILVSKGTAPDEDSYSAFQARDEAGKSLAERLRDLGIKRIFVGGIATDYCVKYTVFDGLREGFAMVVLDDAVRGVNLQHDDSEKALAEMRDAGATRLPALSALTS